MNKKENIDLVCQIVSISDTERIERKGKPVFFKKTVTIQTHDGQILFCEIRKMKLLKNIIEGDIVDVSISFAGSTKNGKRYNNIFINSLTKKT